MDDMPEKGLEGLAVVNVYEGGKFGQNVQQNAVGHDHMNEVAFIRKPGVPLDTGLCANDQIFPNIGLFLADVGNPSVADGQLQLKHGGGTDRSLHAVLVNAGGVVYTRRDDLGENQFFHVGLLIVRFLIKT